MKRLCALAIAASTALLSAQDDAGRLVEWPYVGAEQSHTKYSALADIDRSNVADLEIAWQWDPNEMPLPEYGARPGSFEATPLMIDNTLYFSTMYSRVVALDAETGAEKWTFDPRVYELGGRGASPGGFKHRGVAFRREGRRTAPVPQQPGPSLRPRRRHRPVAARLRRRRQRPT